MPKKTVGDKAFIFAYCEAIEAAARNTTPTGFKLYMYFISNKDNFKFAFSSAHFAETYGCSTKSAKEAFNELVAKGYLTLIEGAKTSYVFHELPQIEEAPISLPSSLAKSLLKKRFLDEETGECFELSFKELVAVCEGNEEAARQLWEVN
jgi:hypothetical protein